MLGFLLGISVCFNIVSILIFIFYFKIKSRKNKILNDIDKNWDNFFASGGFDEKN